MNDTRYTSILEKLDEFIRKYYKNQLLRGFLYSMGLILGVYLTVVITEAIGQFSSVLRTVLFWAFALTSAVVLVWYIIRPLAKLFRMGKTLSYEEASRIVGNHFPEVKDKLLNTLQLHAHAASAGSESLLAASIDQRTKELSPVPFSAAVNLGENRKYLKYALPPLAVLIILLFAAPSLITESTDRLIRFSEEIIPQAPFTVSIENEDLEVAEREDFELRVSADGQVVPDKLFIELNGTRFRLNNASKTDFSYTFKNVDATTPFRLYADGFYFGPYELEVLPKPVLINFSLTLDYPLYTGLTDEMVKNTGDITVPEGTKIAWDFRTGNTDQLTVRMDDSLLVLKKNQDQFTLPAYTAVHNVSYTILPSNNRMGMADSVMYRIRVKKDEYPVIRVEEERDSLSAKSLFFSGDVQDDYGFRNLSFVYTFTKSDQADRILNQTKRIPLPTPSGTGDGFFYHWALDNLDIAPGEEISYYFEVWDNDVVNGSKSARSMSRVYAAPTIEEVRDNRDQENEDIKDKLEDSIDEARDLQKELDELRKEMMQKEELGWQEKKKLEELLERQKNLQKQVEQIQQQNEQKNQKQSEFEQPNESLLQKQQQLQDLMEQVMTDELKQLYDEIQKLMEELNKDELQQQMENMNMTNEDLEKELDRALEQFKQLEWEQKMEEAISDLEKLAEKQDELSKEAEKKDADSEKLKEEQEKLNEEFKELSEELKEIEKLNEELENPNNTPDTEEQEQQIQEEQQKSSEQLDKKKNQKASESQKKAAEKMQEMAQQMQQSMQSNASEQQQEDMDALRALLENIITLSFDQEDLMANFKSANVNDPKYVQFGQVQRKLKDDARMVEDSLFALSKRVPQISGIVNREIGLVNDHMSDALAEIGERKTNEATMHQQYVMTSFNNLALLLDEALKQMQQQQACQKPGQGNCEKPGGNGAPKPSAGDMKKMQEALSKQLEQMKKQMGKDGNKGENKGGQGGMSKELAKMAAQQGAIRQMMEKLGQQLNEDGSGNGNEIKEIAKEMEKIEQDIVNRQVTQETLDRQKEIMIRLLKAENAERTRDQDEKRKSQEGDQNLRSSPMNFEDYKRRKEKEIELLRTVPPSLKPYYKEKINEYFNNLGR
jgi:hypothetical protein